MVMAWQQDVAFDKLRENADLIQSIQSTNEDTTRLRAIDTILFDVLGWDKAKVETERYCRAEGYADYVFPQDQQICLVLEAKKSGATFVIPDKRLGDRPVGFALLEQECPEAGKALRQAAGYAASLGARYIVISNGHQWILALTFVPSQPIEERSVFVFQSLDDVQRRFSRFWDCFSPEGVFSNSCASQLLESRKAPAPQKLSASITNYPRPADRNSILNQLEVVVGLVWDELNAEESRHDFLKECYVPPNASADSLAEASELLRQRSETDAIVSTDAVAVADLPQLIHNYHPERPVVVLGRIGHGKTTFLRYLRLIEAESTLDNYVQIEIDFLDRPDTEADVTNYVYGQIDEQLRDRYEVDIQEDGVVRGSLHSDLARFKKSPEGKVYAEDKSEYRKAELAQIKMLQLDRHTYLAKVFYHLRKGRGRSLALFFDNLDRRSDLIQENAFLQASRIARDWSCLVFVCLRPGTFQRSRGGGVLDTVAPKVINVVPPRTDILLRKRLSFASRLARGEESIQRRAALSPGISVNLPATAEFLDCAAESFFRSAELRGLFESVSNGNVRALLNFVRQTLTSKHLNTAKILEKINSGEGYRMPVHEARRAMLYGDWMDYDPNSSVFINVFELHRADPLEHFSRPLALKYLNAVSKTAPTFGYCPLSHVTQSLCQLGFSHDHAMSTMDYLLAKQYCESRVPDVKWETLNDDVRITTLGAYHITHLLDSFNYYDAVVVDTPVLDENVRKKLGGQLGIRDRLERGRHFVGYLSTMTQYLQDSASSTFLQDQFALAMIDIDDIATRV